MLHSWYQVADEMEHHPLCPSVPSLCALCVTLLSPPSLFRLPFSSISLQLVQPAKATWLTGSPFGNGSPVTPEKHVRNVASGSIPSPALNYMKTVIRRAPGFVETLTPYPLPLTLSGRKPLISGQNHIKPNKNHLSKVVTYCAQATNHINRLFGKKNGVLPDNAHSGRIDRIHSAIAFAPDERLQNAYRTLTERIKTLKNG